MEFHHTARVAKTLFKLLAGLLFGAGVTFALLYSNEDNVPTVYGSVLTPEEPPTSVVWTNLNRDPEYFRERRNAVRQVEKSEHLPFKDVRMWIAKDPNQWGEVIYELPVETSGEVLHATLNAAIAVHLLVDPLSRAEIWLRSSSRPEWERVLLLHVNTDFQLMPAAMDVTTWLQDTDALEVKFRLLGTRILSHPDPDSLIGPAGAQAMRGPVGEEKRTLELKVWSRQATD